MIIIQPGRYYAGTDAERTATPLSAFMEHYGAQWWATDTNILWVWDLTQWVQISGGGGGSVDVDDLYVTGTDPSGSNPGSIRAAKEPTGQVAGNTRGIGAVDLQQKRSNASEAATGNYSNIPGGQENTASAFATVATGYGALADQYGMRAHASSRWAAAGDSQFVEFLLRAKTTTGAAVTMSLDGAGTRLLVPLNKIMFLNVHVGGQRSTGTDAGGAHYIRKVMVKNISGTTSIVGSVSTIGTDYEGNAAYNVSITADDTNDALQIDVTGAVTQTIRWIAHVHGLMMTLGS